MPDNETKTLFDQCGGKNPKKEKLDQLAAALEKDQAVLAEIGNLTNTNTALIIKTFNHPASETVVETYMPKLKKDLGYKDAPMLEKLAIDAVVLSWLRWQTWETHYTQLNEGQGVTLTKAAFWEKKLTAAQGRYLKALATLARIQKLARRDPALQLNIAAPGGQQVNISGDYVKTAQDKPGETSQGIDLKNA